MTWKIIYNANNYSLPTIKIQEIFFVLYFGYYNHRFLQQQKKFKNFCHKEILKLDFSENL